MSVENVLGAQRPPVRVGIAGLGRAALFDHIPAFKALPGLYQVMAVCDLVKERRDIVEKDYPDVHTYRRVEDMLDDPEIDLVLVTFPTADHFSTALSSLRRERWTVVEAPLTTSHDDAKVLQAASVKARHKLYPYTPGLFAPDFRLAQSVLDDARLGEIFEVRVRVQDYVRRDDWQSVKRCLGGCAWYRGQDALLQAVTLMRAQPAQLWSELKRLVSLGDAEDFAHIVLKSRGTVSVDIEICGGHLPPFEPSFTVRGTRGSFSVLPGATTGTLHVLDPDFKFTRRRSSVRTPPLTDMHEALPVVDVPVGPAGETAPGAVAFWRTLYSTIRTAAPFPVPLDDVVETIRYLQLIKRASPFNT